VAVEIMILCLRPLPAANGGWSSVKWRTPKLAAPVSVRPVQPADWLAQVTPQTRAELGPILQAPFLAALRMEGPATTFELALAYAGVVAEACAGVIVLGDELVADRRASVEVWSGPQIEERWRAIDAEAARAEPDYQPVRGVNDDHRPTQSFAFPIVLDGLEITRPNPAAIPAAAIPPAPAAPSPNPERRAVGSEPPALAAGPAVARSAAGGDLPAWAGPRTATGEPAAAAVVAVPPRTATAEKTSPGTAAARAARESPAVVTVPARTPTGDPRARTSSTERDAAQIRAQFDAAAAESTHDAATAIGNAGGGDGGVPLHGGDDDWSDVMPD
jgi:hypothetical protein